MPTTFWHIVTRHAAERFHERFPNLDLNEELESAVPYGRISGNSCYLLSRNNAVFAVRGDAITTVLTVNMAVGTMLRYSRYLARRMQLEAPATKPRFKLQPKAAPQKKKKKGTGTDHIIPQEVLDTLNEAARKFAWWHAPFMDDDLQYHKHYPEVERMLAEKGYMFGENRKRRFCQRLRYYWPMFQAVPVERELL